MYFVLQKDLRPVLAGIGVMAWVLSFPFYGPLAFQLLGAKAVAGTHSFAFGHAAGFLWLGRVGTARLHNWVWPFAAGAVCLSGITLGNFPLVATSMLFGAAGFLAASPVIAWAGLLTRVQQPVPIFVATASAANLWCWLAGLPFGNLFWSYLWLVIATLGFLAAALFLRSTRPLPLPPPEPRPIPWTVFWPLLLFAVAAHTVGGLLYRVILPLVNDYRGIAWVGFLPYVLAMIVAGQLARRNYGPLSASALALLGLAILPMILSNPLPDPRTYLFSYIGILTGLAFADLVFWLGMVNLARAGSVRVLGFGIGISVLILWITSALVDFIRLTQFFQMPLVAFGEAAILFILLPIVLPRLGLYPFHYPPDNDGELFFSKNLARQKEFALASLSHQEPIILDNPAGQELSSSPLDRQLETYNFTAAEKRILLLLLEGRKNLEIAALCFVSPNTVKFHVRNILRKTGCRSRQELKEKLIRK